MSKFVSRVKMELKAVYRCKMDCQKVWSSKIVLNSNWKRLEKEIKQLCENKSADIPEIWMKPKTETGWNEGK